jgi:hypothetical protein
MHTYYVDFMVGDELATGIEAAYTYLVLPKFYESMQSMCARNKLVK